MTDERMAPLSFTGSDRSVGESQSISGKEEGMALELGNAAVIVGRGLGLVAATAKVRGLRSSMPATMLHQHPAHPCAVDAVFEASRERAGGGQVGEGRHGGDLYEG